MTGTPRRLPVNTSRAAAPLPLSWPLIPEPAASERCERCSWAWRGERMRIKVISRMCSDHARYLAGAL